MGWRALALMTMLALVGSGEARADVVEVTGWQVNVRERPSRSAPVMVTLYRGERFELLGRAGSWYHVTMVPSGRVGYVHSSLVRVIPGATLTAQPETTGPAARPAPAPAPPTPVPTPQSVTVAPATAARPAYPPSQSPEPPARETVLAAPDADSQPRQGFWIGLGAGYGSASASSDGFPAENREGSFTGFLKLGGTLNHEVLLGVESNAWVKTLDDVTLTLGNVSGTVTFYPKATFGFFLKGGVGLSYMSTEIFLGDAPVSVSKSGWGLLAGVGYDVRVGRKISITPSVNFHFGEPGNVSLEGETVFSGWHQNVFDFGIGITFH